MASLPRKVGIFRPKRRSSARSPLEQKAKRAAHRTTGGKKKQETKGKHGTATYGIIASLVYATGHTHRTHTPPRCRCFDPLFIPRRTTSRAPSSACHPFHGLARPPPSPFRPPRFVAFFRAHPWPYLSDQPVLRILELFSLRHGSWCALGEGDRGDRRKKKPRCVLFCVCSCLTLLSSCPVWLPRSPLALPHPGWSPFFFLLVLSLFRIRRMPNANAMQQFLVLARSSSTQVDNG